ncbi:MAG TPA: pyridoxal-dependent decarboxylase [Candidatus Polarisedimenticolaceae bacterium]|nr:pyridoxal-dependent decarboxylase [Candidatus Polarisedimenticolaceae bacterium]
MNHERHAPLEIAPERFRELGHALVEEIAAFLASLPGRAVTRDAAPRELRALLPAGGVPQRGSDPGELLREAAPLLFEHSLFNGHPRFFGYITSSAAPIGALADLLAAAINPNVGGWQLSPLASEIELQCVRWIAELLGFPLGAGLLVSGGNMANFVGFLAARRARAPQESKRAGLAGSRLRVYASTETHTWIYKAADLFGHGTDAIRAIPVDAELRADTAWLRERIARDRAEGDQPFLVVGNAGTVATAAVDPLPEMAAIAAEHGLWFHVDAAYGGFGVLAPEAPADLAAGLARADSIAVDPHKWLYAPLEAGCALVREPTALSATFGYTPSYYSFASADDDPRVSFYELGPQNSRGFRALKVWLGLRQAGREGYARMIADDCRLARELYRLAGAHPELEAVTCALSIATFRFVPAGARGEEAYLDALNEKLLERLKAGGEIFLSNAVVNGRFLLRACVVNFRTGPADVAAVIDVVVREGRRLHRELRS